MQKLLFLMVAVLALAAGYYLSTSQFGQIQEIGQPPASQLSGISASAHSVSLIGERRPDFKIGSQTGEWVTAEDFPDKVLLINFWATWCGPCREEMPMLVELQSEYGSQGLQVIGIALDDVQKVREFVQAFGITYTILVGSADVMMLNRDYGNQSGALPYSVLVDRDGIIRWQFSGALQRDELLDVLQKSL